MTLLTITDHHSSTLNDEIYWTISIPIKCEYLTLKQSGNTKIKTKKSLKQIKIVINYEFIITVLLLYTKRNFTGIQKQRIKSWLLKVSFPTLFVT